MKNSLVDEASLYSDSNGRDGRPRWYTAFNGSTGCKCGSGPGNTDHFPETGRHEQSKKPLGAGTARRSTKTSILRVQLRANSPRRNPKHQITKNDAQRTRIDHHHCTKHDSSAQHAYLDRQGVHDSHHFNRGPGYQPRTTRHDTTN